jgi:riboflavin kinase, archaea type
MPGSKPRGYNTNILTLLALVKLGAGSVPTGVSSFRLGKALDITQQAASLRLVKLERAGLIKRAHSGRGLSVKLTDAGLRAAGSFYTGLKGALERLPGQLNFRGTVFTGFGEGGYYVSLKGYAKPFVDALGFEPFPGTLNLRLANESMIEQKRSLDYLQGVEVSGFRDRSRTYGPVKCFKAIVGAKYRGAVLAIERTHYDSSVLEVISPMNLRKALRLRDGDECSVAVYMEGKGGGTD